MNPTNKVLLAKKSLTVFWPLSKGEASFRDLAEWDTSSEDQKCMWHCTILWIYICRKQKRGQLTFKLNARKQPQRSPSDKHATLWWHMDNCSHAHVWRHGTVFPGNARGDEKQIRGTCLWATVLWRRRAKQVSSHLRLMSEDELS